MEQRNLSPRRCRDTRKPSLSQCPELRFYRCEHCGEVYCRFSVKKEAASPCCCNRELSLMEAKDIAQLPRGVEYDYIISGGYDNNTVEVLWNIEDRKYRPEWIFLKTFSGGCMKYLQEGKKPPLRFALADLDAFAYCDADPCLECTFRCKRGFVLYIFMREEGLFYLPLDRFSPHWQSCAE